MPLSLNQSYAQIVAADQPSHWWRFGTQSATALPNLGSAGSVVLSRANVLTGPMLGLPGAPDAGGAYIAGNATGGSTEGWSPGLIALPTTDFVSFEIWVWLHTAPVAARRYGLFYRSNAGSTTGYWGMVMTDSVVSWRGDGDVTLSNGTVLRQNDWNHIVGIAGAANSSLAQLWVNGVQASANFAFGADQSIYSSAYTLRIGQARSSSTQSPPAILAEPAIYPYALSGTQIVEHYRAGIAPVAPHASRTAMLSAVGSAFTSAAPEPQPAFAGVTSLPTSGPYGNLVRQHQPSHWWRGEALTDWGRR